MKTKCYIISFLLLAFCSCDFLDYDESVGYEKEDMFAYFSRAKGMLTNAYGYMQADFGSIDGAMRDAGTDDAAYVWNSSVVHRYSDGSWSPIALVDDVWKHYYDGIRAVHIFLENRQEDFEDIMWNEDYKQLMQQYVYYPYEARFLRAYFYFELAKRYKSIPLLTRTYELDEINQVKPADFDEVIEFIVSECDTVMKHLPATYAGLSGGETGRITQGAAMALKSRVLLYAASPLHNEGNETAKWKEAAKAAKTLIDASEAGGWYQLVEENSVNNLESKELILERRQGDDNAFERLNFPIGYEGGKSGMNPTQNLVDAFEMRDGSVFDWNNPEHVRNMYNPDRRDPRLFSTVIVNGSNWKGETVEAYVGGKNGAPLDGASKTSYYLKKYVVEAVSLNPNNTTTKRHVWVLFRYAEVLLNYAEAMYEAFGDADYTDATYTLSARAALNRVRSRAGMPEVTVNGTQFRERLRNERRVEFAFEDQRFWDIRRWKIGPQTTEIYGVRIEKNGEDAYIYTRQLVERRKWEDKMYLYPISNEELFKNTNLKQNPQW